MMEARSQDFRLDSSLRDACAEDIDLLCGLEKVRGSIQYLQDEKWPLVTRLEQATYCRTKPLSLSPGPCA
jgi:hypothetical protein